MTIGLNGPAVLRLALSEIGTVKASSADIFANALSANGDSNTVANPPTSKKIRAVDPTQGHGTPYGLLNKYRTNILEALF